MKTRLMKLKERKTPYQLAKRAEKIKRRRLLRDLAPKPGELIFTNRISR